jgi:hypothetical protein
MRPGSIAAQRATRGRRPSERAPGTRFPTVLRSASPVRFPHGAEVRRVQLHAGREAESAPHASPRVAVVRVSLPPEANAVACAVCISLSRCRTYRLVWPLLRFQGALDAMIVEGLQVVHGRRRKAGQAYLWSWPSAIAAGSCSSHPIPPQEKPSGHITVGFTGRVYEQHVQQAQPSALSTAVQYHRASAAWTGRRAYGLAISKRWRTAVLFAMQRVLASSAVSCFTCAASRLALQTSLFPRALAAQVPAS